MVHLKGNCLCGNLTYTMTKKPIKNVICYCKDCQLAGGGSCAANMIIEKESLIIEGDVKKVECKSERDSFNFRYFCPNCGTHIYSEPVAFPKVLSVRAATLIDSSWYSPDVQIYTSHAPKWALFYENVKSFPSQIIG